MTAVALGLVLVGCGGDSSDVVGGAPPTDAASSSAPSTTTAAATTAATGVATTTATTKPVSTTRRVDPYLQPGVVDQIFPPGTKAYEELAAGACGPLVREIEQGAAPSTASWQSGGVPSQLTNLYTAAARACLAQWDAARAAYQKIALPLTCGIANGELPPWSSSFQTEAQCQTARKRVYDWTTSLLNAEKADPSFKPNFPTAPKP